MPATLVSKVETGLRLAMVTIVCAARWKTVSISYSPSDALEQRLVAHVAADDLDAVDEVVANQLGLRHPVAHEADDVGSRGDQPAHEPASDEARAAGDQRRPVAPERRLYHTFHGAPPDLHNSSSTRLSRSVSMHCQKPSCR